MKYVAKTPRKIKAQVERECARVGLRPGDWSSADVAVVAYGELPPAHWSGPTVYVLGDVAPLSERALRDVVPLDCLAEALRLHVTRAEAQERTTPALYAWALGVFDGLFR